MTFILVLYICNFIAAELVKGTVIGILYRRKDYLYYNFLSNIIINSFLNIVMFLFMWVSSALLIHSEIDAMMGKDLPAWMLSFILLSLSTVVIEMVVYTKICDLSEGKAVIISLITNIITFIIYVILARVAFNVLGIS